MRCSSARMASAVSMGVSAGMENVGAADGIKHARTALSMSPQSIMMCLRVCRGCRSGRVGVLVGQKCVCVQKLFFSLLAQKFLVWVQKFLVWFNSLVSREPFHEISSIRLRPPAGLAEVRLVLPSLVSTLLLSLTLDTLLSAATVSLLYLLPKGHWRPFQVLSK